jgi:phage-related protein
MSPTWRERPVERRCRAKPGQDHPEEPAAISLGLGLWEVRSSLASNRIARVIFTLHEGHLVLLHGFIKKTQKTPHGELDLARKRMKEVKQ